MKNLVSLTLIWVGILSILVGSLMLVGSTVHTQNKLDNLKKEQNITANVSAPTESEIAQLDSVATELPKAVVETEANLKASLTQGVSDLLNQVTTKTDEVVTSAQAVSDTTITQVKKVMTHE